jgi:hypothetical protein
MRRRCTPREVMDKHIPREQWYEWDPDLDLNSLAPLCDPLNPSPISQARHRLLLDMLIDAEDWKTVDQILAAYPYLWDEYAARLPY